MIGLRFLNVLILNKSYSFTIVHSRRSIGRVIDGKQIANDIFCTLRNAINEWSLIKPPPSLAVLLVGDDAASSIYVNNKTKAARNIGIKTSLLQFPSTITENELLDIIKKWNEDPLIDGILIQLPLPDHICKESICEAVSPDKDVDGFTSENFGKFSLGLKAIIPCTALAVAHLIHNTGIDITGKSAVICGRSKHVGLPTALLLQESSRLSEFGFNATTTICHRHTPIQILSSLTKRADIVVSATGVPELIRGDMVKKGAIVIDVGITRQFNETTRKVKLVGDVCFEEVKHVADYITPVPGGVGPLTVAMLMKNTFLAATRRRG